MTQMKEIPVIDLYGDGYDLGFQHGKHLRDKIRSFYETAFKVHKRNLQIVAEKESILDFCRRNTGYLRQYSLKLFDEMRGIADGSGLEFDDILFLNSVAEMEDLRPKELGGKLSSTKLWGCTSFNILPQASKDGKPYIGQTYDMERYYSKYNVILRIRRNNGPDMLVYTLAGILGLNGMNDRGIGVVINKLVANDAREGVIYPFIIRNVLDMERIGDAFGAVVFSPRATGMNYQLASKDGIAWSIEVSAGYYNLLPFEEAITHTNHYLSEAMRKYETRNWLSHGGSYVRQQVSSRMIRGNIGAIDLELLKNMTKNHTNFPRCICAHGGEGQDEYEAFSTIAAVIYDLGGRKMYACHENPCTNEYSEIIL